jgi:hypothetical protein
MHDAWLGPVLEADQSRRLGEWSNMIGYELGLMYTLAKTFSSEELQEWMKEWRGYRHGDTWC